MTTVVANLSTTAPSAINVFPLSEDQFINMAFITQFTGLTDKWFYKLIQEGKFPRPVKFGRSSRWLRSELEAWVQERVKLSRDD